MKFCSYAWSVKTYRPGDKEGKPTGSKQVYCEEERGHRGEHRCESATSPNIRSRESVR